MEDTDAQLQLKKRARRRLVGAVAFAALAAVVLPMIMDQEPQQTLQNVEIRIPGQDEKPFAPKFAAPPATERAPAVANAKPVETVAERTAEKPSKSDLVLEKPASEKTAATSEKPVVKPPEKPVDKPVAKPTEKPAEKPVHVKPTEKPVEPVKPTVTKPQDAEAQRAASILSGKAPAKAALTGEQYVILIGAFTDQSNVKNLQTKLSELGIKGYTEPLDSPQGRKTRVRAGPFASRDAAEKALEKMKRIGVGGVVTAKQ